jgi:protein tyrosine/serine phosphatase
MDSLPKPVFIHCQHGCDRTGTIIACYRIKHEQWTRENAWQEAVRYGISRFERGMKSFVKDFANAPISLAKQ